MFLPNWISIVQKVVLILLLSLFLILHDFIWLARKLKELLIQGFSMVPFYHRDKIALIAFGGNKKEPCNEVKQSIFTKEHISYDS